MAVWLRVQCPHCHSTEVVKHGKLALPFETSQKLAVFST
ncbi:IS1 family transposase [Scytonema sp. PCC 10023]